MARIRTIKPEFPQSETIGKLSRDARLLFVQLWTVADDAGRLRGASRMLASLLYPYDDDAPGLIGGWLDELEAKGCIRRYEVEGAQYIEVCNWLKHQKIDRPSKSHIPPFDEASRMLANVREASATDLGPRTSTKDHRGADAPEGGYAFDGKIVKLRRKSFDEWVRAYPNLDLIGELTARDAWLASDRATDADRKRWFVSTSQHLANRNMQAKAKVVAMKPDGRPMTKAEELYREGIV